MSRENIAERRKERLHAVARILYSALGSGDTEVFVNIIHRMTPSPIRFENPSRMHQFLHDLPLTLETKALGQGKRTCVIMDSQALCFIDDKLGIGIIELLRMRPERKRDGYMSLADFYQTFESIPDFAPMGDPIFTTAQAPRF